jgi:hypothetical protein
MKGLSSFIIPCNIFKLGKNEKKRKNYINWRKEKYLQKIQFCNIDTKAEDDESHVEKNCKKIFN